MMHEELPAIIDDMMPTPDGRPPFETYDKYQTDTDVPPIVEPLAPEQVSADFGEYSRQVQERYLSFWELEYGDSRRPIGSGGEGSVYSFTQDGHAYAAKYGRPTERTVKAFHAGAHIENISHLEAVSFEEGVTIMDLVPGERTDRISVEDKLSIPSEHTSALIKTVMEMNHNNLVADLWEPGNILYDKERGFSVIDYGVQDEVSLEASVGQVFMSMGALTASRPVDNALYNDPAYRLDALSKKIELMNRFLDVLADEHPDFLQAAGNIQQALNDGSEEEALRTPSLFGAQTRGLVYDIHTLPPGEPYDSFKARVISYRLDGPDSGHGLIDY